MAAGDPDVLYAAADGPQGAVLKSSDGGDSWTAMGSSIFSGVKFGGIAVSPVDPNIAYTGVFRGDSNGPGGVYKTTDGGATWLLITGFLGDASHVIIDRSHPNTLYAGFVDPSYPSSQGIWKSTDAGATWANTFSVDIISGRIDINGGFSSILYIELALAPSDSQVLYAVVMQPTDVPQQALHRSTDGGGSWTPLCPTAANPDNRDWH
jgi:photosystem II stability/assembly factor-like uncharacterized protein